MEYSELLKAKGFSLNSYPEGKFWEMIVTDNEDKKQHICNVFGADIELFDSNITDIDTLILQCAEDFTKYITYNERMILLISFLIILADKTKSTGYVKCVDWDKAGIMLGILPIMED